MILSSDCHLVLLLLILMLLYCADCSVCPHGWHQKWEKCFYFSNESKTWNEAKESCPKKHPHASLVSIHDFDKLAFVVIKMRHNSWLGLNYVDKNWIWSDGTKNNFTNWDNCEPNNLEENSCAFVDFGPSVSMKGMWNNMRCSHQYCFVCKLKIKNCPPRWLKFNGDCYLFSDYTAEWDEAEYNCKEINANSNLASVSNKDEMIFISEHVKGHSWIGLRYDQSDWTWSDGSLYFFTNWFQDEPRNFPTEDCVILQKKGQWNNILCDKSYHYICHLSIDKIDAAPLIMEIKPTFSSCPPLDKGRFPGTFIICKKDTKDIDCDVNVPVGTKAEMKCKEYYQPQSLLHFSYQTCRDDGEWHGRGQVLCRIACGKTYRAITSLISFGESTHPGDWPWHTALYRMASKKWRYQCGGTLVDENAVVTAAHCVTSFHSSTSLDPKELSVYLGKHYFKDKIDTNIQHIQIKTIVVHDHYNPDTFDNDIAFVFLETTIKLTSRVNPICLPEIDEQDPFLSSGNIGTVAGFGVNELGQYNDELSMVKLPIVDDEICQKKMKEIFRGATSFKHYCAGFNNGSNVCNGDSGGGMYFPTGSGSERRWSIHGIVSFGYLNKESKICDHYRHSFFIRVQTFMRWISYTLSSYGNNR